ncbi:hypothetical protein [Nitrosomonas aestuarii]|uniref:hypothetical protein n=1 Tax=Nitrosomonas aestuarii TaxID=52441 RepID=UPI0011144DB1|nr:hypothetical protein [Nitrosomonas aestuarii]
MARPTIVSKQSGSWFDAATWQQNRIPGAEDVVKVERGHAVHYNGMSDAFHWLPWESGEHLRLIPV